MSLGALALIAAGPPSFERPVRAPLDGALSLTSNFGEPRESHFHAGLDFSTGGQVGRPVHAPVNGRIVRVRASGVGYGRSLYLEGADGRLFVFGHLDAFAPSIAAYVESVQDSTGQYEQDLWPGPGVFKVRTGEVIAWTGASGAGPPHLHFEVRRGDVAYNPLRAGLSVADTHAPTLWAVTLEPLDEGSRVQRGYGPRRYPLTAARETLTVRAWGRVRATVRASDATDGRATFAPWEVVLEDGDDWVACRLDSASWATDMADADAVFGRGRTGGDRGEQTFVMYAPAGVRPTVLRTRRPASEAAGVLVVEGSPRLVRIEARDLAGHRTTRMLRLVPEPPEAVAPHATASAAGAPRWLVEPLPEGRLRIVAGGTPPVGGAGAIHAGGWHVATTSGRGWTTIVPRPPRAIATTLGFRTGVSLAAETPDPTGVPAWITPIAGGEAVTRAGYAWRFPAGALAEPATLVERSYGAVSGTEDLAPLGPYVDLMPEALALAKAMRVAFPLPAGVETRGAGVYRFDGRRWGWVGGTLDSGWVAGETRRLGRFAMLRDTLAPAIGTPRVAGTATRRPYPRRAIVAPVSERGSGLDARGSRLVVDGRPVPSEWDPESGLLRWRPLAPLAPGPHIVEVVARDRAGNEARLTGRVVLD